MGSQLRKSGAPSGFVHPAALAFEHHGLFFDFLSRASRIVLAFPQEDRA